MPRAHEVPTLPKGVVVRRIEPDDGSVYHEVRKGDFFYRVPGETFPEVQEPPQSQQWRIVDLLINGKPSVYQGSNKVTRVLRGPAGDECMECGRMPAMDTVMFCTGALVGVALGRWSAR